MFAFNGNKSQIYRSGNGNNLFFRLGECSYSLNLWNKADFTAAIKALHNLVGESLFRLKQWHYDGCEVENFRVCLKWDSEDDNDPAIFDFYVGSSQLTFHMSKAELKKFHKFLDQAIHKNQW